MQLRKISFRTLAMTVAFAAAMGFGATQAIATDADDPGTQNEGCNAWACKKECGTLGGNLGSGGPGKPLRCFCCG